MAPALRAIGRKGHQAEIAKEHVDIFAIRDGTRRGGMIGGVHLLLAQAWHFPPPQNLPSARAMQIVNNFSPSSAVTKIRSAVSTGEEYPLGKKASTRLRFAGTEFDGQTPGVGQP